VISKAIVQPHPVSDTVLKVVSVAEQTIEECMELMTEQHVRHLPVLQGEQLIGIISIGDVVKAIISEQEFMIEQLEKYIGGYVTHWAYRSAKTLVADGR
jgi:CBS domain-containing protein